MSSLTVEKIISPPPAFSKKLKRLLKDPFKAVIYFMIVFVCIMMGLESFGMPGVFSFLLDFGNLILAAGMLTRNRLARLLRNPFFDLMGLLFVFGIFIGLLMGVPIASIVWAMRNNMRFLIFFAGCLIFLSRKDIPKIFGILDKLFWINILVFAAEYVLGYRGDYLGGIFGMEKGANAYLNIFLILICSWQAMEWAYGRKSLVKMGSYFVFALMLCALAEIKVFFVEAVFIAAAAVAAYCLIHRSVKTLIQALWVIVIGAGILAGTLLLLYHYYPNFANFFNLESMISIMTNKAGYSSAGDVNRLSFVSTINETVPQFHDAFEQWFGMGLGSTEYSTSLSFVTSQFYEEFNFLHYYWFSTAWIYLEQGCLGLLLYPVIFLMAAWKAWKNFLITRNQNLYCSGAFALIVMLLVPVLFIYNQSLRLESAYLIYFAAACIYLGKEHPVRWIKNQP